MPIARYLITNGLSGCYLPDNHNGPYEFHSRAELANAIRYEIEWQEFPKSSFGQVGLRELWKAIERFNSSSSMHFRIEHKNYEIAFHGLTEEEYNEQKEEEQ